MLVVLYTLDNISSLPYPPTVCTLRLILKYGFSMVKMWQICVCFQMAWCYYYL